MILGLEAHTAHISTSKLLELELLSLISGLPGAHQMEYQQLLIIKGLLFLKLIKASKECCKERSILQMKSHIFLNTDSWLYQYYL